MWFSVEKVWRTEYGFSARDNILKIIKRNLIGTSVGSLSDQVMLGLKNSGHRQPSIELPIPGPQSGRCAPLSPFGFVEGGWDWG